MRTGYLAFQVPNIIETGPTWEWHEENNGVIHATPLIDDLQNIYTASVRGGIYKFSPSGETLWRHDEGMQIPDVPVLMHGMLFATNIQGNVFALDMHTGEKLWTTRAGQSSTADTWAMTAGNGIVVAAVSKGKQTNDCLVGLNATNGNVMWNFRPDLELSNVLGAITKDSLLFSDVTGAPYRINLQNGSLIWKVGPAGVNQKVEDDTSTGGSIVGPNGVLYVTSNTKETWAGGKKVGHVTAFNVEDGAVHWRQSIEYETNTPPAVGWLPSNRRLAVVIGAGANPELDVISGRQADQTYQRQARVIALDAGTGGPLWSYNMPSWTGLAAGDTPEHMCAPTSFASPAISGDGTVYIGYENGKIYSLRDKNNNGEIGENEVSIFHAGNAFQGSPALSPNMLVATPCNGLLVFRTNVDS